MRAANVLRLGIKELRSLARDPMMLVLIVYAFTFSVYAAATAMPETLNKAPLSIVDEDQSPLSARIAKRLLSAAFPHTGDDHPDRDGCPDGRRDRHLRPRYSRRSSSATCWPGARPPSSSMSMRPA